MTDCQQCAGNKSGYDAKCIDCCARLIMSTGRKGTDADRNRVIVGQRKMLFNALQAFPDSPKRAEIEARILEKYS